MGKDAKKRRRYSYPLGKFSMVEVVITDGPGTAQIYHGKTAPFRLAINKTVTGSFSGPDPIAGTDAIQGIIGEKVAYALNTERKSKAQSARASKPRKALLIPEKNRQGELEPNAGEPVTREWLLADREKFIGDSGNVTAYGWQKIVARRLKCSVDKIRAMIED